MRPLLVPAQRPARAGPVRRAGEVSLGLQVVGLWTCAERKRKKALTLIKVVVALFNLYGFNCLQDVRGNLMNPSVSESAICQRKD